MLLKQNLREHFKEIRRQIIKEYADHAAEEAARFFANMDLLKVCKNIACYLPFKDEFNSLPTIEAIWQAQKKCFLPILSEENKLSFVQYRYGDALHKNRFGILEPKHLQKTISPSQLDIVITPLIAFDARGVRLGTGGGYYDRSFAFLHDDYRDDHRELQSVPHMLGLAYAAQQADSLPCDPWDITLEAVITEAGIVECV